jgi:hypothetical protein
MLYFYFYQLLTAFNNIKIMSEVTHDTGKRLKLFTNSIDLYLIEETAALNASTEPVKTMGCDSWFHSGADTGFQVRGAHLKKLRRAEGSAKIVGVFRVKNHDFTPKNHIFSNFRGGGGHAPGAPPPGSAPAIQISCEEKTTRVFIETYKER